MKRKNADKEVHHIYDPVFRSNFYFILSTDQKELVRICKERLNIVVTEKVRTEGRFMTAERAGCMVGIIWVSNRNTWIIAHEVLHAVAWGLSEKGIPLTFETEEVYAYLTQYLTREIYEYLTNRFKP